LRHRDQLLDGAEQIAQIGYCEWNFENHCVKSCSDGYARIFNQTVSEVLDSQGSWDRMIETVHPDDREHYARSYESQMQDGRHEVEYRIIRNDGETRFIYETGPVEFDDQGKNSFGFVSAADS
jgi:PAS domain-containing protein